MKKRYFLYLSFILALQVVPLSAKVGAQTNPGEAEADLPPRPYHEQVEIWAAERRGEQRGLAAAKQRGSAYILPVVFEGGKPTGLEVDVETLGIERYVRAGKPSVEDELVITAVGKLVNRGTRESPHVTPIYANALQVRSPRGPAIRLPQQPWGVGEFFEVIRGRKSSIDGEFRIRPGKARTVVATFQSSFDLPSSLVEGTKFSLEGVFRLGIGRAARLAVVRLPEIALRLTGFLAK